MAVVNIRDSFVVDVPMFSYLFFSFLKEVPPAGRGIARSNHLFISLSLWVGWLVVVVAGLFHFPNERLESLSIGNG